MKKTMSVYQSLTKTTSYVNTRMKQLRYVGLFTDKRKD